MSAGVANLGMGWDVTRNPSATVVNPDAYAQQLAAMKAPQTQSDVLNSIIAQQAQKNAAFYDNYAGYDGFVDNPNLHNADYWQQYLSANAPAVAQGGGLAQSGWFSPDAVQQYQNAPGLQADYDAQRADLLKKQQDAAQNQQLQQQAYNQQTGGGFAGGLLNGSYSQPFSNTLGASSASGFNGGMMGAGQAPAASTGLSPWMPQAGGSSASSANSGAWGGPFSAKNPWSLG